MLSSICFSFAPSRRFHMNLNHGGCENDKGYIAVVMSAYYPCQYDKQPSFPVILYAESAEPVQFEISSGKLQLLIL